MAPKASGIDECEEKDLARRYRESKDPRALSRLVEAHMGLVVRMAQDMARDTVPLEDLIQEGNVALTLAAKRYDERRGARLATYATFWIRAYMLKYVLRNYGPVKANTTNQREKIFFQLGRARRSLGAYGDDVDIEALALQMGVPVKDAREVVPYITSSSLSLDAPTPGGDRVRLDDFFDEPAHSEGADWWLAKSVEKVLGTLTEKERKVVSLRYLSADGTEGTYRQIGRAIGLSPERVRQIMFLARNKLKRRFIKAGLWP